MARYIHQLTQWPQFVWDATALAPALAMLHRRQSKLLGRVEQLGFDLQNNTSLETLTLDVLKSSEIEGEQLDAAQVRSSLARRMGLEIAGMVPADRHVEGVVEMMLDATQHYSQPLTSGRLWGWQAAMFPGGYSGMYKIVTGQWRNNAVEDPMQVVSGPLNRQTVHFEAPVSAVIPMEMSRFLDWFNDEGLASDPLVKAAIAHLWFVTIHPFDDGNGRIARAITDMQLARADGTSLRFYSMSAQVCKERKAYYDILESSQKGNLDVSEWLQWFLQCLSRSLDTAEEQLGKTMAKSRFWEHHRQTVFNARQTQMLNKLLDGFEGKLNSSKWAKITKTSSDSAIRDINDLLAKGVLQKEASGGRSTSYLLAGW